MLEYSKEAVTNGAGKIIYFRYNATFTGDIVSSAQKDGCCSTGPATIFAKQKELDNAFDCDQCKPLILTCNNEELLNVVPNFASIKFSTSNDNWTQSTPYTIDVSWDAPVHNISVDPLNPSGTVDYDCVGPPYVSQTSENWSITPADRDWETSIV